MKRTTHLLSILAAALLPVLLAGCGGSGGSSSGGRTDPDPTPTVTFGVSPTTLTCESTVRESNVTLTATGSWYASSSVSWCAPVKMSGTGNANLTLWLTPNITSKERTGTITFTSGTNTATLTVTQPAYSGDVDDYVYYIPVVFHVMYETQGTNGYVSKGWLAKVMEGVNKYYAANNTNIQFVMAEYNEAGETLSEPGVMRHQVASASIDCDDFLMGKATDNDTYASWGQNLQRYINLYTYSFTDDSTLGISDLAIMSTSYELDSLNTIADKYLGTTHLDFPFGCCINSDYIYEHDSIMANGKTYSYNTYDVISTVAHELGHYLGLLHAFSDDECKEDDACDDTEISDYDAYLNEFMVKDGAMYRNGEKIQYMSDATLRTDCKTSKDYTARNIMDYMYCYHDKFTEQQLARMRHVLYYSPFVAGPKLVSGSSTRAEAKESATVQSIRPRTTDCPEVPKLNHILLK